MVETVVNGIPEQGQLVEVRQRKYVVVDVAASAPMTTPLRPSNGTHSPSAKPELDGGRGSGRGNTGKWKWLSLVFSRFANAELQEFRHSRPDLPVNGTA